MAKVTLSISGAAESMTSNEVKQKLSALYNKPEQHFEKLCQSLFIMQQPFVLLKNVEQDVANKHVQRLTALGFECDFGDGGLTLVEIADTAGSSPCCPACEQPCGNTDQCQHCGVTMRKYTMQKELDDKLQKQLQSAENSHDRISKFQSEQANKAKEQSKARAKQRASQQQKDLEQATEEDETISDSSDESTSFTAQYKEKRNYAAYSAIAATALIVGGGGFLAHDFVTNRYTSDAPQVALAADSAEAANLTSDSLASTTPGLNKTAASIAAQESNAQSANKTVFDEWSRRKIETVALQHKLAQLIDEEMTASATGLVAENTDPHLKVFGQQELLKLGGQTDKTDRKLLSIYMLVLALEDPASRVAATLNHSTIYRVFGRHDEAVKAYDQAAILANRIENSQQKILAETAIAEHHIDYGSPQDARSHYQMAKDQVAEVAPSLHRRVFGYIAISEVSKGLTADAQKTAEQIADPGEQQQLLDTVAKVAYQNTVNGIPELAAAHENKPQNTVSSSDSHIDELIKKK